MATGQIDMADPIRETPSVILCDQLRSISKDRLGKASWGTISAVTLAQVEKTLRTLLGL
jgi:mRNA interferase MazF